MKSINLIGSMWDTANTGVTSKYFNPGASKFIKHELDLLTVIIQSNNDEKERTINVSMELNKIPW